jgi:hypothetical protein
MNFKICISFYLVTFQFFYNTCLAESFLKEPEPIVSITQVFYEKSYYIDQVDLWEAEIMRDSKNPDAWMNYQLSILSF